MKFGMQIKKIRTDRGLTQEQMADKLQISRQAVSNWENDRNLPDIEMLIMMAKVFGLSLDELILGGTDEMNEIAQKLIHDGRQNRRARLNLVSICIGAALLLAGVVCIVIKAATGADVAPDGFLEENFFLLPIAFLFFLAGFVVFLVTGISSAVFAVRNRHTGQTQKNKTLLLLCMGVVLICGGGFLMLLESNSGLPTAIPGGMLFGAGIALGISAAARMVKTLTLER